MRSNYTRWEKRKYALGIAVLVWRLTVKKLIDGEQKRKIIIPKGALDSENAASD